MVQRVDLHDAVFRQPENQPGLALRVGVAHHHVPNQWRFGHTVDFQQRVEWGAREQHLARGNEARAAVKLGFPRLLKVTRALEEEKLRCGRGLFRHQEGPLWPFVGWQFPPNRGELGKEKLQRGNDVAGCDESHASSSLRTVE